MDKLKTLTFFLLLSSVLLLSCDKKDDPKPPTPPNPDKNITAFSFSADLNGLTETIIGVVNEGERVIRLESQQWIANTDALIATFTAVGTVTIGNVEQESEVTAVDFTKRSVTYTVTAEDESKVEYTVVFESPMTTGLPVFKVDIENGEEVIEKTKKLNAVFTLIDHDNSEYNMTEETMTIRGRGNSTWTMPKKPYRIDFPEKTSLFGKEKAKKWVLLANYLDPTLLMNDVTFELGRRAGLQFTHSSTHVELFINGTYRGNYQLTEQKEKGKGRVDIDKNEGYLLEMDDHYDEDYKFKTNRLQLPIMVADAEIESENDPLFLQIKSDIQGLEDALFDANFPNTNYKELTDINSLIDFMIINEIVLNEEVTHPKSVLLYKNKNEKIHWGPLWDFDYAFGFNYTDTHFFYKNRIMFSSGNTSSQHLALGFFCQFLKDPDFKAQYKARWQEIKPLVEDVANNYIEIMANKLYMSQNENFKLDFCTPPEKTDSYNSLITNMKQWLNNRISLLDEKINEF